MNDTTKGGKTVLKDHRTQYDEEKTLRNKAIKSAREQKKREKNCVNIPIHRGMLIVQREKYEANKEYYDNLSQK